MWFFFNSTIESNPKVTIFISYLVLGKKLAEHSIAWRDLEIEFYFDTYNLVSLVY